MGEKFELSGLKNIFNKAISQKEPTIVFELANGKGKFLFMIFFDEEDETTKDKLFVFMRNIQKMMTLKLYGNHYRGQFDLYLEYSEKELFKEELQLNSHSLLHPFNFNAFFNSLNSSIPNILPLQNKIDKLRETWKEVQNKLPKDIIYEQDKTFLLGDKCLPSHKTPREKTLRKLYIYADGNADEITKLINILKSLNRTVAWTTNDSANFKNRKKVSSLLNRLV